MNRDTLGRYKPFSSDAQRRKPLSSAEKLERIAERKRQAEEAREFEREFAEKIRQQMRVGFSKKEN